MSLQSRADGRRAVAFLVRVAARLVPFALIAVGALGAAIWFIGSRNPYTPAGYVGYLTKGAVFGRTAFYGVQRGPTSAGRTWLLDVTNVSVTPYTYSEEFTGEHAVLSRDNLKISFAVHTVWRVDEQRVPLFMERYSTTVTNGDHEKSPDAIVKVAYGHFVREPLRTYARDEVQRRDGLDRQGRADRRSATPCWPASGATPRRARSSSRSVVVGNVQYPSEVADAVARKLAATQELARKDTEIEIERKERTKREVQAAGHRQRDADHPRPAERALHPARGDRGAEADGQLAEPHHGLHPGRADGRAVDRHVLRAVCAVAAVTVRTLQVPRQSRGRESPLPTRRNHAADP